MKLSSCYLCGEREIILLYKKGDYNIVKCSSCDFVYVNPILSKSTLNKFYSTFDYHDSDVAEKVIRSDAIRSLREVEKYKSNGKLLDVGCGRGFFIDEARKRGWQVYGIDYSKKVTDYAKRILGLEVRQADIFTFATRRKFDIVTLNQVIEHVSNPNRLMKQCHKLLKRGGMIYLATPNISSLLAKVQKKDFDYFIPPEHLGYYNYETLSKLLKSNGFTVVYSGSWSYRRDLAGIIKRLIGKDKDRRVSTTTVDGVTNISELPLTKRIKYILFDEIFCGIFYKILNFDHWGTNIEIIGIKQ